MLPDMHDEIEATASEYRALVDQLEATRRELLELRSTEVWSPIYPSHTLANEPKTPALVGAKKALQAPLLPGLESGLVASACSSCSAPTSASAQASRPSSRQRSSRASRSAGYARATPAGWTTQGGPGRACVRLHLGRQRRGSAEAERVARLPGADQAKAVARGVTVTTVCSRCLRIRPCHCRANQATRESGAAMATTSGSGATASTGGGSEHAVSSWLAASARSDSRLHRPSRERSSRRGWRPCDRRARDDAGVVSSLSWPTGRQQEAEGWWVLCREGVAIPSLAR